MSATSIFGLVDNETRANVLIGKLRDRGIELEEMSVLFPDPNAARSLIAGQKPSKSQQSAPVRANSFAPSGIAPGGSGKVSVPATSLVAGGVVDGALGWLTGIGLLNVPGVGPLIVSGPLLMALSSLAGIGRVGGISGALVALGFPELQTQRFAEKLEIGCILIAVHARDAQAAKLIQDIFALTNVSDVGISGDAVGVGEDDRARLHTAGGSKPCCA